MYVDARGRGPEPREHLGGVGELRDAVGAHERRHLDLAQARRHERAHERDLHVRRDRRALVLEPVARADLGDADRGRSRGGGCGGRRGSGGAAVTGNSRDRYRNTTTGAPSVDARAGGVPHLGDHDVAVGLARRTPSSWPRPRRGARPSPTDAPTATCTFVERGPVMGLTAKGSLGRGRAAELVERRRRARSRRCVRRWRRATGRRAARRSRGSAVRPRSRTISPGPRMAHGRVRPTRRPRPPRDGRPRGGRAPRGARPRP